jgi:hypothetical protein
MTRTRDAWFASRPAANPLRPVDGDAELLVMHDEHVACIEQRVGGAGGAQVRVDDVRRPHFALAADRIAAVAAGAAEYADRVQHFGERVELRGEPGARRIGVGAEQFAGSVQMPVAQFFPLRPPGCL